MYSPTRKIWCKILRSGRRARYCGKPPPVFLTNGHRGRAHTLRRGPNSWIPFCHLCKPPPPPLNGAFNREGGDGTPNRKQPIAATQEMYCFRVGQWDCRRPDHDKELTLFIDRNGECRIMDIWLVPGKSTKRLAEDSGKDKRNAAQAVKRKGQRLREVPVRLSEMAERFQRSEP